MRKLHLCQESLHVPRLRELLVDKRLNTANFVRRNIRWRHRPVRKYDTRLAQPGAKTEKQCLLFPAGQGFDSSLDFSKPTHLLK